MGDFNDDPISPSIADFLKASGSTFLKNNQMHNTMYDHYKKGIGTLAYRDQWNLFDQFIITPSFIDNEKNYDDFTFYKSVVFNKSFLKNQKEIIKVTLSELMVVLTFWVATVTIFLCICF